nr:PREDICTED: uncharacterized protein LOC104953359 [Notothenia coriiceps]
MSNSDNLDHEPSLEVFGPGSAPFSGLSSEADFLIARLLQQGIPTAPGLALSQLRELSDQVSSIAPQSGAAAPVSSPERSGRGRGRSRGGKKGRKSSPPGSRPPPKSTPSQARQAGSVSNTPLMESSVAGSLQSLASSMRAIDARLQALEDSITGTSTSAALRAALSASVRGCRVRVSHAFQQAKILEGKDVNLLSLILPSPECDKAIATGGNITAVFKVADPSLIRDISVGQFMVAFGIFRDVLCSVYPTAAERRATSLPSAPQCLSPRPEPPTCSMLGTIDQAVRKCLHSPLLYISPYLQFLQGCTPEVRLPQAQPQPHSSSAPETSWWKNILNYHPSTPINIPQLAAALSTHQDSAFVDYLLSGFSQGFRVGVLSSPTVTFVAKNLQSAAKEPNIVSQLIDKELLKGYIIGPFSSSPFSVFRSNPIGIATRKYSGKKRLIFDLSAPRSDPFCSVNSIIPPDQFSLHYASVDNAIKMIKFTGHGALLSKADITDAFKIIPIHPSQWNLFGIKWESKLYFAVRLTFGCRRSPCIFNSFSEALC